MHTPDFRFQHIQEKPAPLASHSLIPCAPDRNSKEVAGQITLLIQNVAIAQIAQLVTGARKGKSFRCCPC